MTYDMSIHQNPDAQAWAEFFIATQKQTGFVIDEDLMIGWFANAMMAMHDHLVNKGQPINGDHAQHLIDLNRDAAKWREYKARKDAVIAAGMGRNPLRETVTCDTYGVINEDGEVEYSASWPEACHDHIKDMQVEHGIGGKWKVRALKYLPVTTPRKEST